MQTPQIQTCSNCSELQHLLQQIDLRLWEAGEQQWHSYAYNTPSSKAPVKQLLYYKRILERKMQNPDYPSGKAPFQTILKKVLPLITSSKKCLCFTPSTL